jgi:hypothetical protein
MPLRPSHFPDSGGIFIFANGVRMEEISRFDRQVKQVKNWGADCTCLYSPYDHVDIRTVMVTWQLVDVVQFGWVFVDQLDGDTCRYMDGLCFCVCIKWFGGREVQPPDLLKH